MDSQPARSFNEARFKSLVHDAVTAAKRSKEGKYEWVTTEGLENDLDEFLDAPSRQLFLQSFDKGEIELAIHFMNLHPVKFIGEYHDFVGRAVKLLVERQGSWEVARSFTDHLRTARAEEERRSVQTAPSVSAPVAPTAQNWGGGPKGEVPTAAKSTVRQIYDRVTERLKEVQRATSLHTSLQYEIVRGSAGSAQTFSGGSVGITQCTGAGSSGDTLCSVLYGCTEGREDLEEASGSRGKRRRGSPGGETQSITEETEEQRKGRISVERWAAEQEVWRRVR